MWAYVNCMNLIPKSTRPCSIKTQPWPLEYILIRSNRQLPDVYDKILNTEEKPQLVRMRLLRHLLFEGRSYFWRCIITKTDNIYHRVFGPSLCMRVNKVDVKEVVIFLIAPYFEYCTYIFRREGWDFAEIRVHVKTVVSSFNLLWNSLVEAKWASLLFRYVLELKTSTHQSSVQVSWTKAYIVSFWTADRL